MVGKIYRPTPEQLARWDEEMKHWKEAHLTNKEYYDAIDAKMHSMEQPTINDALEAAYPQGNKDYIQAFPYLKNIEKPFQPGYNTAHEIAHIAARLGHTPQQEKWMIPFYCALRGVDENSLRSIAGEIEFHEEVQRRDSDPHYIRDGRAAPSANARDMAIYFAAGMYLHEKIRCFQANGMQEKPYEQQRAFAEQYKDHDQPLVLGRNASFDKTLPYALIQLSREEWKAIISVATGLREPQETAYEKRLTPIKAMLKEAGLVHDMKPWAERRLQNHAEYHPREKPLDPEKFREARERRGADEPGRG